MKVVYLFLFMVFLSACPSEKPPNVEVSDDRREKIAASFTDPITDKYHMPKLKELSLPAQDLEIRFWVDYSYEVFDGFFLKRTSGVWSATAVKEIDCKKLIYYKAPQYQIGKIDLSPPISGWENFWAKLQELNISELSQIDDTGQIDGQSYILETKIEGVYRLRTYPITSNGNEKEREYVKQIGNLIANEFGLDNFRPNNLCLEK